MAHRNLGGSRKHYSFVDVLERVTDGVHVHIVGRESGGRDQSEQTNDAPRRPEKRGAASKRPRRHRNR